MSTCDCRQCRIRRVLFDGNPTPFDEKLDKALGELAVVAGLLLTSFDEVSIASFASDVVRARAEYHAMSADMLAGKNVSGEVGHA